jgi:hypothetical protein
VQRRDEDLQSFETLGRTSGLENLRQGCGVMFQERADATMRAKQLKAVAYSVVSCPLLIFRESVLSVSHAVAAGGDSITDIFSEDSTRRYRVRY